MRPATFLLLDLVGAALMVVSLTITVALLIPVLKRRIQRTPVPADD